MITIPVGMPAQQTARRTTCSDDRQQLFGRLMQSLEKDMWQSAAAGPQSIGVKSAEGKACDPGGRKIASSAFSESVPMEHDVSCSMGALFPGGDERQQVKGEATDAGLARVDRVSEDPHFKTGRPLVNTCENPCLTPVNSPPTMAVERVRLLAALRQEADTNDARETSSRPLFEAVRNRAATNVIRLEVFDGSISLYLQSPIQQVTAALKHELLAEIHRQGLTCRRLVINADASYFTVIEELDHAC